MLPAKVVLDDNLVYNNVVKPGDEYARHDSYRLDEGRECANLVRVRPPAVCRAFILQVSFILGVDHE